MFSKPRAITLLRLKVSARMPNAPSSNLDNERAGYGEQRHVRRVSAWLKANDLFSIFTFHIDFLNRCIMTAFTLESIHQVPDTSKSCERNSNVRTYS